MAGVLVMQHLSNPLSHTDRASPCAHVNWLRRSLAPLAVAVERDVDSELICLK